MESWDGGYVDSLTRTTSNPFLATDSSFTSAQKVSSGHVPDVYGLGDSPGEQVIGDLIADFVPCRISRGRDVDGLFLGEEVNMFSKFSSTVVDQSPLIDLKLGSFTDQGDGNGSGLPQSVPSRKCRAAGISNQMAYCQVYDCNKDLSKSKDYYKRHKVCEVHSKTPTVIVGGIEQRFCQQCSRFHLLREFDDGKRSCRKRLAGHNERRRKPQVGFYSSGRAGRLFLPYDVGKFHGMNDWLGNIKLESGAHYSPLPSGPFLSRDVHPRVPFSSPSYDKGNKESSTTVNMFSNISLYSGPRPLLNRYPSLGSEEFDSVFNAESPIQGLPGISEPGCALSLLSAQSRDSSSHTSGIPTEQSLSQYSIAQFSDNLVVNSGSSKFLNLAEGSQTCPGMVYDGHSAGVEIPDNILHTRELSNRKDHPLDKLSPTINLLQLSSELQRVEHERQYMKLENESFCL